MGTKLIDETGNQHGRLLVLERAENLGSSAAWLCQCDCGELTIIKGTRLRSGNTRSCGCLQREIAAQQVGPYNPAWRGGISYKPYDPRFTAEFKRQVMARDLFCCQVCGNPDGLLHVHHIDYDKQHTTVDNCITLCGSCHIRTNHNRKYWYELFTDELGEC